MRNTTMDKVERSHASVQAPHVTFDVVLRQLRKHDFAVLSTAAEDARPASAGVTYGVSQPGQGQGQGLALYVIPLARRFLWFLPPPTIQLHGHAEILDWTDADGTEVFRRFWMGRRILAAYWEAHRRGESRICFLKITLDPAVSTYMVGTSIWELRRRMEAGAAKVLISADPRR